MFCYDSVPLSTLLLRHYCLFSSLYLSILFPFVFFVSLFAFLCNLSCIFLIPLFLSFHNFSLYFSLLLSLPSSLQPSALLFLSGYVVVMRCHDGLPTIFTQKNITKGEHRERLESKGGRHEKLYLACIESPGLGEVMAKGKRKAFIKVSTSKAFLSAPCSLPLSQNQCSKIPQSQILLHPINYSTCLFCTTTPVYKDCLANCKCLRAR